MTATVLDALLTAHTLLRALRRLLAWLLDLLADPWGSPRVIYSINGREV